MASSAWKLRALLKKNLLEMKRHIISTLCEILFPIILMALLYLLKTAFDIKNYEFDIEEGTLQNFIKSRSVYNLDKLPYSDITPIIPRNVSIPEFDGMSLHPAFNICSLLNSNHKVRKLIATIGVPDEIKKILITESLYYSIRIL
jgi:hypothetical protein